MWYQTMQWHFAIIYMSIKSISGIISLPLLDNCISDNYKPDGMCF